MRRIHPLVVPILAAGAALGAVATGFAQQPNPNPNRVARPLKVGVVDIGLLFKEYKRKDDFEKEINRRRELMKKEIDGDAEGLKDSRIKLERSALREGGEAWLREREKIKMAQYSLELKTERLQAALKNEVEQQTLQILTEIEGTIELYGKQFGYDLILKIDKSERGAAVGQADSDLVAHFQERIFRAQISDVLYYNREQLDITGSVLVILNGDANIQRMAREAEKNKK